MLLLGLTGGIASGKSTVSRYLVEKGITVIDADRIAVEIVEPGKPAWKKIKKAFGSSIIKPDETINREKLGDIIFNDPEKRKLLNSITHPYIQREMAKQVVLAFFKFKRYVILDLPLLFEVGQFTKYFYKIIVVNISEETQLTRLLKRDKLEKAQAQARISAQMPLKTKCEKADYVIDNEGSVKSTMKQVDSILTELNNSNVHLKYRFIVFFLFLI
ncbi:dephospho-CoA kinase-like [Panonychus citri]|uniref:dephospho-CoA kinase-like n=1 Tax=Panonychus citri TaxID=50023 RepID=UPI002307CBBE|nr:dephospho-CoA kinase-like [Panonychus citri]